jgi:hypothetical protein
VTARDWLLIAGSVAGACLLLPTITWLRVTLSGPNAFTITTGPASWLVLGAAAGFIGALRLCDPRRMSAAAISESRSGDRTFLALAVAGLAFGVAYADQYARFTEDGVHLNRFFAFAERHYHFAEVGEVFCREYRGPRGGRFWGLLLRFRDGSWWSSGPTLTSLRREQCHEMRDYVAARAHLAPGADQRRTS